MADDNFKTQRQRIFLLLGARMGEWVPLTAILDLRIGQYGARILELRRLGHKIECRDDWEGRTRHTWYRLVPPNPKQVPLFEQASQTS